MTKCFRWERVSPPTLAGVASSINEEKQAQIEASIENEHAPEVGIQRERLALLWQCNCGELIVTSHLLETVKNNILYGSRVKQLRDGGHTCKGINYSGETIEVCERFNQRLNSAKSTKVLAAVPTNRPASVRNLRYIAEALNADKASRELNAEVVEGAFRPRIEYLINEMWFESVRGVKQGKGKYFWCMPIRRWKAMLRGEF